MANHTSNIKTSICRHCLAPLGNCQNCGDPIIDPQTIVEGILKTSDDKIETITFTIRMLMQEWMCVVPIPDEGRLRVPVTIKNDGKEIIIDGVFKDTGRSDIIVFTLQFSPMKFEVVCIVTIPNDEQTSAPVYLKHRLVK
jgi:hypothetical protein